MSSRAAVKLAEHTAAANYNNVAAVAALITSLTCSSGPSWCCNLESCPA